jgi:hypothetical protein
MRGGNMPVKKYQVPFIPESEELKKMCDEVREKHGLSWNKFLNVAAKLAVEKLRNTKPIGEQ